MLHTKNKNKTKKLCLIDLTFSAIFSFSPTAPKKKNKFFTIFLFLSSPLHYDISFTNSLLLASRKKKRTESNIA